MTDTLRDIPREITEVLNENWVPSRVVYGTDEPDGFSSVRGWAAHVAEAILAIPGIAVVELPEPDHHEPATEDTNGYVEWRYPHGSIATTDDGTIMWERWHITNPSKVRAAAAALLAAADHAERDQ